MKRWIVLALLLATAGLSAKALVGPDLFGRLAQTGTSELLPVNIILNQQADNAALEARCANLNKEERWALVVNELKNLSQRT